MCLDTRTIQPRTNASKTNSLDLIHVGDEFMKCFLSLGYTIALIGEIVGLVVEGELWVDGARN